MNFSKAKGIGKFLLLTPLLYILQEKKINTSVNGNKLDKDPRKIVVLDPGHGFGNKEKFKMDWGDAKYKNYREVNITLKQAEDIKNMLNPSFYNIILTRTDNCAQTPLYSRPELANRIGADIFISLHVNNFRERSVRGFEVYYRENKSKELAKLAAKNLEEIALIPKRRVKKEKYLMLKGTNCPSILIESEYLSNKRGRDCILDTIPNIETAVVKTIEEYFKASKEKGN